MLSKSCSNQIMKQFMRPQLVRVSQRGFSAKKEQLDGNTMNAGLINLGFAVFVREKFAVLVHRL